MPSQQAAATAKKIVFSGLFTVGANVFAQNAVYNPTGPVGALAYWTADAIKSKYLKNPRALV